MRRSTPRLSIVLLLALAAQSAGAAVQNRDAGSGGARAGALPARIWRDPGDVASLDLFYGAGGKAHAPDQRGTFTFIREDVHGWSPKFLVVDEHGAEWKVKLGPEARPETAATRFLWAAGYFVDEDYHLADLTVRRLPALRRGREYVSPSGLVRDARLERKGTSGRKIANWDWFDNPFLSQRELNGLRVMMALVGDWDLKATNNAVYAVDGEHRYAVGDLGATFGRSGNVGTRTRGVPRDYAKSSFIERVTPELIDFELRSRPAFLFRIFARSYSRERTRMEQVVRRIPREDALWMGRLLSRLTEAQIRDAFRAAGYGPAEVEILADTMRSRIAALGAL